MSSTPHESSTARAERFYDADTERKGLAADDAEVLLGTVTEDAAVVRQRDRLEKAHLGELLRGGQLVLRPDMRVLDLGGGAGRIALWMAPHVAEVVLVDASAQLLKAAEAIAARRSITNISTRHGSVLDPVEGQFDLVVVFNVAAYLHDDELPVLVDRCVEALVPGGRLLLKEPICADETLRADVRRDDTGQIIYELFFRPRAVYAEVFARRFTLRYQAPTCAHMFPFFLGGTDGAVKVTRAPGGASLVDRLGPTLVRLDPWLRTAEAAVRAQPLLAPLLAPVQILQDFYVLEPHPAVPAPSEGPAALSVVVIAYNEADCLLAAVEELRRALIEAGVDYELVLVDDGSVDATPRLMQTLADGDRRVVVCRQENKGIGGALRTGFDAATGVHVTWVPADGQIAPASVVELFERRAEAPMLTTVYRHRDDPWYRLAISKSLNTLIKLRTGQVAKSGGNYLFERAAWLSYGPRDDDSMMISTAFRHALRTAGQRIIEVEIDARARMGGRSKVLNPRAIGRTLRGLFSMGEGE